jgi:hypothetical protein
LRPAARAADNCRMRWIAWGSWLLVCLASCTGDQQGEALSVCAIVCRCQAPPVKAVQDQCVDQCVGQVSRIQLPQTCLDCVFGNADRCNTIETTCNDACDIQNPPPPTGGGSGSGGGVPVDAGI